MRFFLGCARKWVGSAYEYWFQKNLFRQTKSMRQAVIDAFEEPADDFERSYFQYSCQMKSLPAAIRALQNLVAIPALAVLLLISRAGADGEGARKRKAVYLSDGIDESIIPDVLKEEFEITALYGASCHFGRYERKWMRPVIRRYWRSPYFLLKCYVKVCMYAELIRTYHPAALITYAEFSFSSSLTTAYLQSRGIEHINVLHGEKLLNTRDVFVRFHRFYVWDESYCNLFVRMRAEKSQFRVEIPPACRLHVHREAAFRYSMTYYMGNQSEEQMINLREFLDTLEEPKERICIRMHPRFGNRERIRGIFSAYSLEEPETVPLEQSLGMTRCACGLMSTVISQALWANVPIILDDVSDTQRFALLADLQYPLLERPHRLLSEVGVRGMRS